METQKILAAAILVYGAVYALCLCRSAWKNRCGVQAEKGRFWQLSLGEAVVFFFTTMGFPDFILNTLLFQKCGWVEDKRLPGTLVASSVFAGAVIAFSYLRGGEALSLSGVENHLVADGMESIIRVLEDLEDEKYDQIDFVELRACPGGCLGGSLQLENPYIARTKLKRMQRTVAGTVNRLAGGIPTEMLWDTDLTYAPVLELGATRGERFERYNRMQTILKTLPGLDCGACGAPSCEALAEDVVRGTGQVTDCVLLRCRQLEARLKARERKGGAGE